MSAACTQFHEAVEGQAGARLYQEEPARSKANQKETEETKALFWRGPLAALKRAE